MEAQEKDNAGITLEGILNEPEKNLYLTKAQMNKLELCCNKLINKIKKTSDEDIQSGKVTKEQCIEWIKELQYESIAIADLLIEGKGQQADRLKSMESGSRQHGSQGNH